MVAQRARCYQPGTGNRQRVPGSRSSVAMGRGEKRERSNLRLRQFSVEPRHLHAAGREGGVPTLSRSVPAPGVRTVPRDRRVPRANRACVPLGRRIGPCAAISPPVAPSSPETKQIARWRPSSNPCLVAARGLASSCGCSGENLAVSEGRIPGSKESVSPHHIPIRGGPSDALERRHATLEFTMSIQRLTSFGSKSPAFNMMSLFPAPSRTVMTTRR